MIKKNTCGQYWLVYWISIIIPKILGLRFVVVDVNDIYNKSHVNWWIHVKMMLYSQLYHYLASMKML